MKFFLLVTAILLIMSYQFIFPLALFGGAFIIGLQSKK